MVSPKSTHRPMFLILNYYLMGHRLIHTPGFQSLSQLGKMVLVAERSYFTPKVEGPLN
jgi:hypothetical protein